MNVSSPRCHRNPNPADKVRSISVLGWLCVGLLLCYTSVFSQENSVLVLDGKGAYAVLPSDLFVDVEESTVEMWAKWDELRYYAQLFAFGSLWQAMGVNHWENTPALQFFIYDKKRDLHLINSMNLYDYQNSQPFIRASQGMEDLFTGQWHHIAAVAGKGGMKLYMDGVLVSQNDYEGSFSQIGGGTENFLGRSPWESNAYFAGSMDEVRVWDSARTAEQLRAHMYRRLQGDEKGLLGLWNFDQGDGRDLAAGAHHADLVGGAQCASVALPDSMAHRRPVVVHGVVRDPEGKRVHGAQVVLDKGGKVLGYTWTDMNGHLRPVT